MWKSDLELRCNILQVDMPLPDVLAKPIFHYLDKV